MEKKKKKGTFVFGFGESWWNNLVDLVEEEFCFFLYFIFFLCQCGNTTITALSKKCFQLTSCFHSFLASQVGSQVFKDCLHITIYPPWQRPGHSKPHLTDIIASLDSWLPPPNLAPLDAQTQNFSEMSLVRLAKPLTESVYGRS